MGRLIKIFDTTLRDGEQSPGCSMNLQEKIQMAKQLEILKVDVIEAGFAIASPGDFAAVKEIAKSIKNCTVASLARTLPKDITCAWEAIQYAAQPRIHTFIATSDIHMKYKLKLKPDEVIESAISAVKLAKQYCADVEFSAEDATRSNPAFLYKIIKAVIDVGATVINIPDTVGYSTPDEIYSLIYGISQNVSNIHKAEISVHCHNDLGLAVANSLAAVKGGATQIECTINGIGERAGNAALEEIVMGIHTRKDIYSVDCNVETKQILRTSKLLSTITGIQVQPNKAIVGANAFAHESGIHQHGVMEERSTYEIMSPETIGLSQNKMVLGKHSGRHAFHERLKMLGFDVSKEELDRAFLRFKELADKKKEVDNRDIEAIMTKDFVEARKVYTLKNFVINSGNKMTAMATVKLAHHGKESEKVATGDGPVDAVFRAIEQIIGKKIILQDYSLHAVTEGKDAQGEAIVKIKGDQRIYTGRGLSTDVIEASIHAYVEALNKMVDDTPI
ncbi:2-isopropylmalate synthase [Anaerosolibacter carboniphilus]|uniref:2-isopropylmalate synthase n=1 Tax=Anaerosolibacter carboniphilus TaxID=1417629 RepID=A0A841KQJ5_9FIRM|nr:2-isopropylmalate synthase [Anaerosolibacter carboniphilus]MBB6215756.1 2-isopropylmalate synthase [Anaerosolibacter carboniphilus]